ncbi:hypothetical protein D3C71_2136340 [compost metagenome]
METGGVTVVVVLRYASIVKSELVALLLCSSIEILLVPCTNLFLGIENMLIAVSAAPSTIVLEKVP